METQLTKLRLVSEPMPTYESPMLVVPSIEYDSELDCFYVSADDGAMTLSKKQLPANFHTHELIDVDPSDVGSLLAFQKEWGLLTSPARTPFRYHRLGTRYDVLATPTKDGTSESDIEDALRLLSKLDERHNGFGALCKWLILGRSDTEYGIYPFVPRGEVVAAVEHLQATVNTLTKAAKDGFDNWAGIEGRNLEATVDDIEQRLTPYFPRFAIALPEKEGKKTESPTLPLTIATLSQLIGYLTSEEGYRECAYCHKYFVYKRHTRGEYVRVRNRRSLYCSDDCKFKAASANQAARRKAARHAAKEAQRKER